MTSNPEALISADSHVMEPPDLWEKNLPPSFRDRAPRYAKRAADLQAHQGGTNPALRAREMAMDGVCGEVLYPSLAMDQFSLKDAALQEACLRVYNDWLIDYCSHAPDRLFGIGLIAAYDIDHAIKEAQRCKEAGMRGIMVWQFPPDELSFATSHYDRLWAAAQNLQLPVSLHILTGQNNVYGDTGLRGVPPGKSGNGINASEGTKFAVHLTSAVHMKMFYGANAIMQIMTSGVFDRFPQLKMVIVENEVSWLPFIISQWDKYYKRGKFNPGIAMLPSEYFKRQIYATFFDDPPVRWILNGWGTDNCMWSNDFPHPNSTWPKSRDVIARDLGSLPNDVLNKLLRDNVTKLFNLPRVAPFTE